jgi:2,5-diketo-D-gluconate reductase A
MTHAIALNDGTAIPQVGFGTFGLQPDPGASALDINATAKVIAAALEVGYRHIDTAQHYGTEKDVGRAIVLWAGRRDDLYVTSKLRNVNHRRDDIRRSFAESLLDLGLEQLDLFLVHWPFRTNDSDYLSSWSSVTELLADGRLRSAGVSNFLPHHIERIIAETGVLPAVNQIEVHPHFANSAAREASARHGIAVVAWSPLGQGHELGDPVIAGIAAGHDKSAAQAILRWHLQHGHVVIPKSSQRARMAENLDVFDFELTDGEMAAIDALDRGEDGRVGPHPDTFDRVS